ncbi:MAG TPA: hypothetical protein VM657_05955 [Sphingomonas sp.]|nr:hypothetical protein [Sphingomonas sp.]
MMAMVQLFVFVGALALIVRVVAETILPALPRMAALLRGEVDPVAMPRDRSLTPRAAVRAHPPVVPARHAMREAA